MKILTGPREPDGAVVHHFPGSASQSSDDGLPDYQRMDGTATKTKVSGVFNGARERQQQYTTLWERHSLGLQVCLQKKASGTGDLSGKEC